MRREPKPESEAINASPQPPGKERFITKAEARRRASQYVVKRLFKDATVLDGAEVRQGRFFSGGYAAEDVWVVYRNQEHFGFQSSEIVVVSKRTGQVVYEGSAGDEG